MSKVASGTVAKNKDCRICDLKAEFNRQINASSVVIFVVGNMTKNREAGSKCERKYKNQLQCFCTPYKQNTIGVRQCKVSSLSSLNDDIDPVNSYSYLRHEFEQAKTKNKKLIVVYNSMKNEHQWLPSYMKEYENKAFPFWIKNEFENKIGNYPLIKRELGF